MLPYTLPVTVATTCAMTASAALTTTAVIATTAIAVSARTLRTNTFAITFTCTSQGGQMSRVLATHSGRSGNLKIVGLSPKPTGLNPGRV